MNTSFDRVTEEIFEATSSIKPLAPLAIPEIHGEDTSVNEEAQRIEERRGKKPRTTTNLNEERLCGNRGIPALPKLFENVKFPGKNHGTEDLTVLLSKYKLWTQMLFPKHQFIDVVDKVEHLSSNKRVNSVINVIRRGEWQYTNAPDELDSQID